MKHQFEADPLTHLCHQCGRGYMEHVVAKCNHCGELKPCEIFGRVNDVRAPLLCIECTDIEMRKNSAVMMHSEVVERANAIGVTKPITEGLPYRDSDVDRERKTAIEVDKIIQRARDVDGSIKYNGDFFNAQTVAIAAIKKAIMDGEGTQQEKEFRAMNELVARYESMSKVIFKLDAEKVDLVNAQLAITVDLRSFGNNLREGIRERIKAADSNYTPATVIKTPKVVTPKKSPWDRMVETVMVARGITKEEAEKLMAGMKS